MNDQLPAEYLVEFARIIQEKKPYLVAIEDKVQEVQHGKMIVEIDVRSGSVDKMVFKELDKSWLREKSVKDEGQNRVTIVNFVQSFKAF